MHDEKIRTCPDYLKKKILILVLCHEIIAIIYFFINQTKTRKKLTNNRFFFKVFLPIIKIFSFIMEMFKSGYIINRYMYLFWKSSNIRMYLY